MTTADRLQSRVASWVNDPSMFARDCLGFAPWTRQEEMMQAVADHPRVVVRSGHKTGKSRGVAALCPWWAMTRPEGRVILTAPGATQVKQIIWRELASLRMHAPVPLGGEFNIDPGTGWNFPATGAQIIGVNTNEPERMAGYSGAHVLIIVDEGSGVSDEMFEAIEGNMAGGAKILITSNPTRVSGQFYRCFGAERMAYHCLHISSEESPNVAAGRILIPGLATREWIEERRRIWGPDSNLYRVRVRGDFPSADDGALIPLPWIEEAIQRGRAKRAAGCLAPVSVLAVDVGMGSGADASVIAPAGGRDIHDLWSSREIDTMGLVGEIVNWKSATQAGTLAVDADGIGGPVIHRLQEQGIAVEPYHGGEPTDITDRSGEVRALNVRGMAHWWLREALDPALGADLTLPDDPEMVEDLTCVQCKNRSDGRIQIEDKAQMKNRLGRSPDKGDAVVMANWYLASGAAYVPLPRGGIVAH